MERADDRGNNPHRNRARHAVAFICAFAVHGALFVILSFVSEKPLAVPAPPIPVKLVILDASPPSRMTATEATTAEPESTQPEPTPPDEPTVDIVPKALPEPRLEATPSAPPASLPLTILSTEDEILGDPIPEKWRLPHGASIPLERTQQPQNPNLAAISKALDCLGFDADCAAQRKDIFAEAQLSDTDLVWMRSYAHSGLSDSSLYGLSEAQIRDRLGIMSAGENGLMIFPGIAIDGPWWDALHGVNKACDYGVGVNDLGAKQLMKSCDPGKPSSKDRIGFIPKSVE